MDEERTRPDLGAGLTRMPGDLTDTVAFDAATEATAWLVASEIRVPAARSAERPAPMTRFRSERGLPVYVFRSGAVVFFGATAAERGSVLEDLKSAIVKPNAQPPHEEIQVQPGATADAVRDGDLFVREVTYGRCEVIAEVLAKSILLDHYETTLAASFDRVESFTTELSRGDSARRTGRELLQQIGAALAGEVRLVARGEILEKPELIWDDEELERLYLRLEAEFELRERLGALERKIELLSRSAQFLLELRQAGQALRVEWLIVLLIVVEILLFVYELARGGK